MTDDGRRGSVASSRWWSVLLIIPYIALLWVPFYNRVEPSIAGVPFFYWYQFLWVILTSVLIVLVHSRFVERPTDTRQGGPGNAGERP